MGTRAAAKTATADTIKRVFIFLPPCVPLASYFRPHLAACRSVLGRWKLDFGRWPRPDRGAVLSLRNSHAIGGIPSPVPNRMKITKQRLLIIAALLIGAALFLYARSGGDSASYSTSPV